MNAEEFFTPLLNQDPSGRQWLRSLLQAVPAARRRFDEVAEHPGSLSMGLSVRGVSGRLGAFEYPLAPSPGLVGWLIDHPEALTWPEGAEMSPAAERLRRALIFDDPPGARARAQQRAHELLETRSILSEEWWRFQELGSLDCLLMTDRLLITIDAGAGDPGTPATPWHPARSRLTQSIEAARDLAGERRWGCLLMTEAPVEVEAELLSDHSLSQAVPHLAAPERRELREGYLGNLTWAAATQAIQATPDVRVTG